MLKVTGILVDKSFVSRTFNDEKTGKVVNFYEGLLLVLDEVSDSLVPFRITSSNKEIFSHPEEERTYHLKNYKQTMMSSGSVSSVTAD